MKGLEIFMGLKMWKSAIFNVLGRFFINHRINKTAKLVEVAYIHIPSSD